MWHWRSDQLSAPSKPIFSKHQHLVVLPHLQGALIPSFASSSNFVPFPLCWTQKIPEQRASQGQWNATALCCLGLSFQCHEYRSLITNWHGWPDWTLYSDHSCLCKTPLYRWCILSSLDLNNECFPFRVTPYWIPVHHNFSCREQNKVIWTGDVPPHGTKTAALILNIISHICTFSFFLFVLWVFTVWQRHSHIQICTLIHVRRQMVGTLL